MSPLQKPAFFQLVLHPVKASYIYSLLRVTQSKNRLYARQRRNTANGLFHECLRLFNADYDLMMEYHALLDGKWNHMLRQPHYGYSPQGLGPSRDMIEGLCWVQTKTDSNPSVGHMGIAVEGHEGINPGICNEDSDRTHPSRKWLEPGVTLQPVSPYGLQTRYFEIYHRGTVWFDWEARPQYPWIRLCQYEGTLKPDDEDVRIYVSIDWQAVPKEFDEKVYIEVIGSVDGYEKVRFVVQNRQVTDDFNGFVETDNYISIDAGKWVSSPYTHLPAMGRQVSGSVTLPNSFNPRNPDDIPFLCYNVYTFSSREDVNLELHFNMTLDTDPKQHMEYDLRWDNGPVTRHRLVEDLGEEYLPKGWSQAVMDCVWKRRHGLGQVKPGSHVVEVRFRNLNIVLEKAVLDLGGTDMEYLGPPESECIVCDRRQDQDVEQDYAQESEEVGDGDTSKLDLRLDLRTGMQTE